MLFSLEYLGNKAQSHKDDWSLACLHDNLKFGPFILLAFSLSKTCVLLFQPSPYGPEIWGHTFSYLGLSQLLLLAGRLQGMLSWVGCPVALRFISL